MTIIISPNVQRKLAEKDPPINEYEILECFQNRSRRTLIDRREKHKTRPPTRWFIAETNYGRKLKIVFITHRSGNHIIKTAFEPDKYEEEIYESKT